MKGWIASAISVAAVLLLLRYSLDSSSVVERCVSLLRGSPRQSSGGRSSSEPSLRRTLLWLAQAWMSVPSTLKCSPESRRVKAARIATS